MNALADEFRRIPFAHRALHDITDGRPENSRAAIRAAVEAGYGIELDLQLSRDARAMVFHDYDLNRLTGETGPIRERDAGELGKITLLGGDEGIPMLKEVLEIVAGQVPLLIELKDQHGQMGPTDSVLERATADELKDYKGQVAVMSFNPNSVLKMAELTPDTPRGIVTGAYMIGNKNWHPLSDEIRDHLREIHKFEPANCAFISHEVSDLNRPRVAEIKAKGATILCWTVRSPAQEIEARKVANNITFEGYRAEVPS